MNHVTRFVCLVAAVAVTLVACDQLTGSSGDDTTNSPPSVTSVAPADVDELAVYSYAIVATDPDGDALTMTMVSGPAWLSLTDGVVGGTAPKIDVHTTTPSNRSADVECTVSDGEHTVRHRWTLTVRDVYRYASVTAEESIQDAIDAVPRSDGFHWVLEIASGTFDERLEIDRPLTLRGAGSGTDGTVIQVSAPQEVFDPKYVPDTAYSSYRPSVVVAASGTAGRPVTLQGLRIRHDPALDPSHQRPGILFEPAASIDYVTIRDVAIVGNLQNGTPEQGITVAPSTPLRHLVVDRVLCADMGYGMIVYNSENEPTVAESITISSSEFRGNGLKGFYTERLSESVIRDSAFHDNGDTSRTPWWAEDWTAGIDINLKFGAYRNLQFLNLTVVDNGSDSVHGAGLAIKARGTGDDPNYAENPATLTGVLISGGTYTRNTGADIRFGEPDLGQTQPQDVEITRCEVGTLDDQRSLR